jgi:NAD(P)-dependent dehydrogenase (short-subunit alcohol dehydrogenase family)
MPNPVSMNNSSEYKAYVITGPTSGIGRATTLEVIKHGKVVLVGRDREKLNQLQKEVERKGGHAVSVVCDLSDLASVRRAAAEIIALDLPIVGLLNNAGIFPMRATKNALGWDNAFATNHIGPFVLTEALISHLPDDANVVFVASGVEDPERKPARWRASVGAGTSPQRRAHAASGSRADRRRRARTPMPHRSNAPLPRRWSLLARLRGCASTRSNRDSVRPPASGAMPTSPNH